MPTTSDTPWELPQLFAVSDGGIAPSSALSRTIYLISDEPARISSLMTIRGMISHFATTRHERRVTMRSNVRRRSPPHRRNSWQSSARSKKYPVYCAPIPPLQGGKLDKKVGKMCALFNKC